MRKVFEILALNTIFNYLKHWIDLDFNATLEYIINALRWTI